MQGGVSRRVLAGRKRNPDAAERKIYKFRLLFRMRNGINLTEQGGMVCETQDH
jgi:hypothetical protein